jgi:hypothetical protein
LPLPLLALLLAAASRSSRVIGVSQNPMPGVCV